jgi:hypothetical protein
MTNSYTHTHTSFIVTKNKTTGSFISVLDDREYYRQIANKYMIMMTR